MTRNKILAIIPARGGSKRIPNKNIKKFLGKPIISYSIETALASGIFSKVMVSTDDRKIAKIARKYGAEVPFLRSKKNSNDKAGLFDVFKEVVEEYKKRGYNFDYICMILATAPFVNVNILKKSFTLLKKGKYATLIPIVEFDYPIFRALKVERNKVKMLWPKNLNKRSQDLPKIFHDVGLFYWVNLKKALKEKSFFTQNTGYILLNKSLTHDIDTKEAWRIAEIKYRIIQKL